MSRSSMPEGRDTKGVEPVNAVEIKGSVFTLTVLRLHQLDMDAVDEALAQHIAQAPRFFQHAPVVLELQFIAEESPDFSTLVDVLRKHQLIPVGVRRGTPTQGEAAVAAGLAIMQGGKLQELDKPAPTPKEQRLQVSGEDSEAAAVAESATKVVKQPVRSGQRIYARGGDLILLGPVSAGAEVIADGHIHAYGALRGRALAGVNGNPEARLFIQCFAAELVAVAGHYRVFEEGVESALQDRSVQVFLDGEQLVIDTLN